MTKNDKKLKIYKSHKLCKYHYANLREGGRGGGGVEGEGGRGEGGWGGEKTENINLTIENLTPKAFQTQKFSDRNEYNYSRSLLLPKLVFI